MADEPGEVMQAAQRAAADVCRRRMPDDVTAIILVIPVYRRAIMASGDWRADVKAAMGEAIDRSHPEVGEAIHRISRA